MGIVKVDVGGKREEFNIFALAGNPGGARLCSPAL